jgi:predicted RNase H-like HicB family nuclease
MKTKHTLKEYEVGLYWEKKPGYFVAEIPEIPNCSTDRATQALANVEETFAMMKEIYVDEGKGLPYPQRKPALFDPMARGSR